MRFEWDEEKNRVNKAKHGVSFETARLAFDDPFHLSLQDRHEDGEERWQTLGRVHDIVVLLVAHIYHVDGRGEEVSRIISARNATTHERKRYEQVD